MSTTSLVVDTRENARLTAINKQHHLRQSEEDSTAMSTKIAPWLEGLSDAWEAPQRPSIADNVSSATHDADSLRNTETRVPRRSLSGLPSSLSRHTSHTSTQRRRHPLAPLSNNDANTLRRLNGTTKLAGTRSVSDASDGELLGCGTVQQRSKSSSPSKKQQTLEWKRRLVHGQVGYGDQTDLFGPSGLENIFARSKGPENEAPTQKGRMGWLQRSSDVPMPSSPPPWPSNLASQQSPVKEQDESVLDAVAEEQHHENSTADLNEVEDSFESNPFDLENSCDSRLHGSSSSSPAQANEWDPDGAFAERTDHDGAGNRTVSGKTEMEQEDFSPVFISKHTTVNGQVGYAALDSHLVKQFQNMKVSLRHPSQNQSSESSSQSPAQHSDVTERSEFKDDPESHLVPPEPDLSFSENLPTGSPFPNLGQHVEFKRGGYSQYGSFKQKPLSPSQSAEDVSGGPGASGLISLLPSDGQLRPQAPTPPMAPRTPIQDREPASRSSVSPLKLFGAHDTFTNNRLLRRMSQLNPDGTIRQPATDKPEGEVGPGRQASYHSFGSGDLEKYGFDAEITITSASNSDRDMSAGSPGSEIPVPGSKTPLGFRFESSPEVRDTYKLKRKLSKHSAATSKVSTLESQARLGLQPTVEDASEGHMDKAPATEQTRSYAEGKRPPTSPFKNPTPKRRRTLHASELESQMATVNQSYHSQLQEAVSSRKRRDGRPGESQNTADAAILSQRKILRPRNPTPSQHRRQQIEAELREAAEEFAEQDPEKLEAVMEDIETSMASSSGPPTIEQQAHTLASHVAAFTLNVQKPSGDQTERKRSVTTQDFLNEAMMVMNLIRAKARPQSNLGSVAESDAETLGRSLGVEASVHEETPLRVSRPPSREGTKWRQRAPVLNDARVVSHLRRFQEREERDDTDFIANSIASLQMVDDEHVNDQVVVVDENSNIRITGPHVAHDREKAESDSRPATQRSDGSTVDTHNSNGTSTGRTIGTSSTRKSDNVGTLAPELVAHLIGDQVGGMTFDKDKQRWVRVSKSPEKDHGSFLELPSNVTSDDDPFREISDLPVDQQQELRRISSPGKPGQDTAAVDGRSSVHDQAFEDHSQQPVIESRTSSQETVIPRPVTRDSSHIRHQHSSSIPSRYTGLASSQQQEKVETRATSWSDEELARLSALGKASQQPLVYAAAQAANLQRSEIDNQESQAPEDSEVAFPSPPGQRMPTGVVPIDHAWLAADNNENGHVDELFDLREDTALDQADETVEDLDSPKLRQTPIKPLRPPPSSYRTANRQASLRRQTLTSKFAADAHEQSELSFVAPLPGDRMMSVSLSVSRPVSTKYQARQVTELQSSPSKEASSYLLSDLPEFTVHDLDEERQSERALATRLAQHAAADVNDRYALAVKQLVKILTDVNEDEPYWEDLKQLSLQNQSLASLYGLDDFCTRVQDMDVSNNALTHLHGAPTTTRMLNARCNQLSGLTSWNHMMNLQYLDVSNNHLESLSGLGTLIHLRELCADDNRIACIDGVFELEGLLKLRVRRNKLKQVDFRHSQLRRLAELDLSGNHLTHVDNLEKLVSLADLRLDGNSLAQGLSVERNMQRLTFLSMRNCKLEYLDVSSFPNLRSLNVDDNRLCDVDGIERLRDLVELSMRRQDLPPDEPITVFDRPLDARTVRLSGNSIASLHLSCSFLNLQHLELASVGLQELPDDFGFRMPNLRTLNLNFNSLRDIRPILNIHNLKRLSVCGNRLQRLRKSIATLAKVTSLQTLDLRDNPLTQGFYANAASSVSRHTSVVHRVVGCTEEDEDVLVAEVEKSRYELPHGNGEDDQRHRARLDEDTELRRRVYEVLLANSCRALKELDGLCFDRSRAVAKDSVWDRLMELGIIRRS